MPMHRRPSRPSARGADPDCLTCHGTGRFLTLGKAHEVEVSCPRCIAPRSLRAIPADRRPHTLQH